MPTPSVSADNPASTPASPAERIAATLCGLLPPGAFIEVDEGAGWRGIVRSTGVSADWSDALTIAQTVEVERHYS